MATRTRAERREVSPGVVFASLPGPTRKRTASPYCYRMTYSNDQPGGAGCVFVWDVMGGREIYQIALERLDSGDLRWHCTCADATYRGEGRRCPCKHVRGLQALGRSEN